MADSVSSYFVKDATAVFAVLPPIVMLMLLKRCYIRGLLSGFVRA
ncbi:hypothetical protein [Vulcanisaeta thermophila]|nr:hypothetical protein [Vulcanisaeta thermophila]